METPEQQQQHLFTHDKITADVIVYLQLFYK